MTYILSIVLLLPRLALAIVLFVFALQWRSPLFASIRMPVLGVFVVIALILIAVEVWWWRRAPRPRPVAAISLAVIAVSGGALLLTLAYEGHFRWTRYQVLRADTATLERLGRHVIVGYRRPGELRNLVERQATAGVFISAHNVRGKDAGTIRREIAELQDIRKRQGLPPLLVATDQEGGGVSRMSPPLPQLGTLGDIVRRYPDATVREAAVRQFATEQGQGLADLGFNLNFAPVVDLNHGVVSSSDRYTRIVQRAISDDPAVVSAVADAYCAALMQTGVHCTLKHFPGLGRVVEDTHLEHADLTTPVAALTASDWVPFRALSHHAGVFTMLGHARLTAVDAKVPASFSPAVVGGLLRGEWQHEGVLVTDDFSMEAAYGSTGGLSAAGISALNAGVDLILVTYDPDQFYPVMYALLQAEAAGRLDRQTLERSNRRLAAAVSANIRAATAGR